MARRIAALILILIAGVTRAQAQGPPIKVCMLSGSEEYHSDASLEAFKTYLEANFPAKCTLLKAKGVSDLPGLEALDDCDVALFFTRRLTIDGEQLARIKRYAQAGRPIVAVRTASHGFQNWLEFDKEVLGGNYHGHYRDDLTVRAERNGYNLPDVLTNPLIDLASTGSLYKTSPLAKDVNSLLFGTTPEGREPVSWVRENKGRVFYTSFGTPSDFENASFRQLLANALFWAVERRETPRPAPPPRQRTRPDGTLRLKLRLRTEAFKGSNDWDVVNVTKELPVADTAIVICDMWDRHWCTGATKRCDAIAQHMAPVIKAARAAGVQIVHAPSECMGFYADTPQRLRMKLAPKAQLPNPKEIFEPPLPIDDSDGGCDTNDAFYLAWTRENPRIDIGELDGISDNGAEVYNLFHHLGIKNVLIIGVHTNMCVLNRSFAIRQMTKWGMHCILVRDLTDTMYDPKDRPYVPHDQGTALVVEHIEKYWAPSILSTDLVEGLPG